MSDNVKDQEMLRFIELVEKQSFEEAKSYLVGLDVAKTIKNYNLAYLEYKKGNPVEARLHLDKAKFQGMFSEEVSSAMDVLKKDLDLTMIEGEQSFLDNTMLYSKSLPKEFFSSISMMFFIIMGVLLIRKIKIVGFLVGLIGIGTLSFSFILNDSSIAYNVNEVSIYNGPSRIFEEIQILPPGAKIIFSEANFKNNSDWKYIKYPLMFRGCVYKNEALAL